MGYFFLQITPPPPQKGPNWFFRKKRINFENIVLVLVEKTCRHVLQCASWITHIFHWHMTMSLRLFLFNLINILEQADTVWGCHCPIQQQVETVLKGQNYQKEQHEKQIVVIKDDVPLPLSLYIFVYALLCILILVLLIRLINS